MLVHKRVAGRAIARLNRFDVAVEQLAEPIVIPLQIGLACGIAHAGILHSVGHAVRAVQ